MHGTSLSLSSEVTPMADEQGKGADAAAAAAASGKGAATSSSSAPDGSKRGTNSTTVAERKRAAAAQRARKNKRKPEHKPASDETIVGGKYFNSASELVNAHGQRISEDGTVIEKPEESEPLDVDGTDADEVTL